MYDLSLEKPMKESATSFVVHVIVAEFWMGVPMVTEEMVGAVVSFGFAAVVKVLLEDTDSLPEASMERTLKLWVAAKARSRGSDRE